jgi:hypothetical protein
VNLSQLIALVRNDLRDTDSNNYRWTDDELTRHIGRAVEEFSESVPLAAKTSLATVEGSRDLDISALSDRVTVVAVEYPLGEVPPDYRQFTIWGDTLTFANGNQPDGGLCTLYYGARHTLDVSGSTLPESYQYLVAEGASGYAAVQMAGFIIDKVNVGGEAASGSLLDWGTRKLGLFRQELKRLGRRNRVRSTAMFNPEAA